MKFGWSGLVKSGKYEPLKIWGDIFEKTLKNCPKIVLAIELYEKRPHQKSIRVRRIRMTAENTWTTLVDRSNFVDRLERDLKNVDRNRADNILIKFTTFLNQHRWNGRGGTEQLSLLINEFVFQYNNRKVSPEVRFKKLMAAAIKQ